MKTTTVQRDMSKWTCEKCGHINVEYFPWPVNAECEECGHAQVFGEDVDVPSSITDPKPEPGCDPLFGKRMDSADCGEN